MNGSISKQAIGITVCGTLFLAGTGLALSAPAAKKPAAKPAAAKAVKAAKPAPATAGPAFVDNTPLTEEQKIVHALHRLGFGPRPGDVGRVKALGLDRYIALQLTPEKIDDARVEAKLSRFEALNKSPQELAQGYYDMMRAAQERRKRETAARESGQAAMEMTAEEQARQREQMRRQARTGVAAGVAQLQMAKVVRAVESERQLQEVMVDFWTNHFNIDIRKNLCRVFKITDDRDVIRAHTFGTFRDLLGASAKSPAMLVYLDNAQSQAPQPINRRRPRLMRNSANNGGPLANAPAPAPVRRTRGGINENYAREIMELHTLGVDGGYTQKDVQEVARCLTGWSVNRRTGTFVFNRRGHDDGEKVVLGRRIPAGGGIRDGETVLDILASHPSTARHVSRKLCQRFVADEPPAALVNRCARVWQKTGGDIREVVRAIITSDEFFSRVAYRQKIKSPFEFAVSSVRALDGTIELAPNRARPAGMRPAALRGGLNALLVGQVATLGEPLFQHQAPTGYPEDSRKWVSSGALISRLNFALGLASGRVAGVTFEPPVPKQEGIMEPARIINHLTDRLLHGEVSPATRATLLQQAKTAPTNAATTGDTTTATRLIALVLGSPEFQRR